MLKIYILYDNFCTRFQLLILASLLQNYVIYQRTERWIPPYKELFLLFFL